ncbi:MAG: QueT transporter family protein [Candidatus Odinarchaeia archaeon]
MRTVDIALTGLFTAVYAAGVIFLAPISFSIVQVRVIDCLIPLSAVFGLPMIFGVTAGNIVANIYGGLGIIDIVGGTIANLLAAFLIYFLSRNYLTANEPVNWVKLFLINVLGAVVIAVIVGGYLSLLFYIPIEFSVLSIFIGSLVSMAILGTAIEIILIKQNIRQQLGY